MGERSSVLLFDTQQAVEELVAAGMPPEQASVIVRQQARWIDRDFATGEDIDRLRTEFREEFGSLRGEFTEEFGSLRAEFDRKLEAHGAAIKKDMDHLREEIDHKLNVQRSALETKITQSSADTIRWVTGSQIGTAAVYLAALLAAIKL